MMGRIAAALWAGIAFFAAVTTVGKLRPPGADVEAMRAISVAATVCAGITMVLPWQRFPKAVFNAPLVLMTGAIGGLAYAEGSVRTDLTLLFTFVVLFAAYFMSWRASAVQLLLIGAVLAARLFMLDTSQATKDEALRLALLLPALGALSALVAILRKSISERETKLQAQEMYDFQTGLLSKEELQRVMSSEVSRAGRHARPLSVVVLDVSGSMFADADPDPAHNARVATMIARSILGRIRVEDRAARLDEFRFAVLAPETEGEGAAAFGRNLVDVIRKRLMTLGYEGSSFAIAVGWADYPHTADSPEELLRRADQGVAASILASEAGRPLPGETEASPSPAPSLRAATPGA